jgi:outer membrane biosynthesis protein TonB
VTRKLHPVSRGKFVLLNKLESGFLLFKTQQGLVAVEPSFWERVYLLWTFRNFRQLSLPLLNSRQTALINNLFREHAAPVSDDYEPSLKIGLIGVVENFVPPAPEIGTALAIGTALVIGAAPAAEIDASPRMEANLTEQNAGQYFGPHFAPHFAPPEIPIAVAPAIAADVPLAVKWEEAEEEGTQIDHAEIAPSSALDRLFAPKASWLRRASLRLAWSNVASSNPEASNPAASGPAASRPQISRIAISMFAAAIGALALCVGFGVAFHRVGAVPGSQAHSSPPQLSSPDSPSAPDPTPVAENPDPVPDGPPQPGAGPKPDPDPGPDAAVEPAPAEVPSSTTPTHPMTTPERTPRGPAAHVASRSSGGSHTAALSRVPASTSTRRMTLAPASRGAMMRSAQNYFDLAKQQMHKGNYAAAAANYKRAWRIEEKNAAARGRLVRARRSMPAEKESIAERR